MAMCQDLILYMITHLLIFNYSFLQNVVFYERRWIRDICAALGLGLTWKWKWKYQQVDVEGGREVF